MRKVTFLGLILLCSAAMIAVPAITEGQFGGGKGKGGFGGGFQFDPGAMFDNMAKGKPSIAITDIRTKSPDELRQFVQDRGITNGQLTRQQFIDYYQQRTQKLMGGGGRSPGGFQTPTPGDSGDKKKGFGGFPGNPGLNPMSPGGSGSPFAPAGPSAQTYDPNALNLAADIEFRRRDSNGDGKLNVDEMPPQLRQSLSKWDKNGDGFVDLNEFREYFMARLLGTDDSQVARGIATIIIEEEELDRKPVVYRAGGKMPPGLPKWFKEVDYDEDGQIAIWEWRKGGKDLEDFNTWDANGDGFITPEEASRQQAAENKTNGKGSGSSASSGDSPFGRGKKGGFGGFGGADNGSTERPAWGGFGKGGFGGFGKGNKKKSDQ